MQVYRTPGVNGQGVKEIVFLTSAEYDALTEYDPEKTYVLDDNVVNRIWELQGYGSLVFKGNNNKAQYSTDSCIVGWANENYNASRSLLSGGFNKNYADYSFLFGSNNTNYTKGTVVGGMGVTVPGGSGDYNAVFGYGHNIKLPGSTLLGGSFAEEVPFLYDSANLYKPEYPRIIIGNGKGTILTDRSNLFVGLQSGALMAPSLTRAMIEDPNCDPQMLITKDYFQNNLPASGPEMQGVFDDNNEARNVGLLNIGDFYRERLQGMVMQVFTPVIDAQYELDFDAFFRTAEGTNIWRNLITHRDFFNGGTLYKFDANNNQSDGIVIAPFNDERHLLLIATNDTSNYRFIPNYQNNAYSPAFGHNQSGVQSVFANYKIWWESGGTSPFDPYASVGQTRDEMLAKKFDLSKIAVYDCDQLNWTWPVV